MGILFNVSSIFVSVCRLWFIYILKIVGRIDVDSGVKEVLVWKGVLLLLLGIVDVVGLFE